MMHILSGFQVRRIQDEVIAVPTGEAGQAFSGIIGLNEIGQFLFEQLRSEQTEDSLVRAVLDEYEIDEPTARADVMASLDHLRGAGLLVE